MKNQLKIVLLLAALLFCASCSSSSSGGFSAHSHSAAPIFSQQNKEPGN